MSDRPERPLRYVAGDDGYFYADGNGVFRASFSGSPTYQVNREIINPDDAEKTFRLGQTDLSPDGKWLAVQSYASPASGPAAPALMGSGRKVEIMTYKDRFATARKVDREMPDDKRDVPAMRLYVRPVPGGPTTYGKQPEPVFTYDGGDIWVDMTPIAWSEDGLRYTFATLGAREGPSPHLLRPRGVGREARRRVRIQGQRRPRSDRRRQPEAHA